MNNVTKFVSRVHETDVTRLSNRHILTTGASKMCKFANAQYHQTICAVKSHSRICNISNFISYICRIDSSGAQPVRDQKPRFLLCFLKEPHDAYGHTCLHHSRTYLCSARFIVNITHQHDNVRNLQTIYCYACYSVGLLASLSWIIVFKSGL